LFNLKLSALNLALFQQNLNKEVLMSQKVKRASLRFDPDPGSYVLIDGRTNGVASGGSDFAPQITGLMFNEAYKGFAVVVLRDQTIAVDTVCYVRPAHLQVPLKAVVRWREDFDIGISKVGFEYLE
jgi:hypothetical protein